MNGLIWNCRGVSGCTIPSHMKNYMCIHRFNFMALLEPKISRITVYKVIRRTRFQNSTIVELNRLSGGIWCLFSNNCPNITVTSTTQHNIPLKAQLNVSIHQYLTIVYGSPNAGLGLCNLQLGLAITVLF